MSGHVWRPGKMDGSTTTGDESTGADVYPARFCGSYHLMAHHGLRVMAEGPIHTPGEAQRIAEEWLDLRESEDREHHRKDATT